jgi:hypothetical protein
MADYPGIPSSARFAALTSNNIILNPIHALWRLATLGKNSKLLFLSFVMFWFSEMVQGI